MLCSVLGYLYCTYLGVKLPWSFDAALTGVVFLGAGYLLKEKIKKIDGSMGLFVLFLVINIVAGYINGWVNMFENQYSTYLLFYISAFSGVFAMISLAKKFERQISRIFYGKPNKITMPPMPMGNQAQTAFFCTLQQC